jgi:tetratricopeptide (TPR) repeat protein
MHEGGRVRSVFRALSIDDCSAKLGALAPLVDADLHISGDLEFLTILTALLAHTTSQPAATELYAEATYLYSEWLLRRGRLNEAGKSAHRSLEVRDQCGGPTRSSLNGLYIAAKYEVEGNGRLSPDRGIRFIEKWLPLAEEFGEATHRYRDMAGFAIQARRFDEALRLLDRAIEVAPQAICPRALFMAQSVRADALLMSGNAPGAVRILPEPRTDLAPTLVVFDAFLRARILLAANGKAEASYWTQAARDTIDQFGLANLEGDYARITRVMT